MHVVLPVVPVLSFSDLRDQALAYNVKFPHEHCNIKIICIHFYLLATGINMCLQQAGKTVLVGGAKTDAGRYTHECRECKHEILMLGYRELKEPGLLAMFLLALVAGHITDAVMPIDDGLSWCQF
jgi:hypothetical protein